MAVSSISTLLPNGKQTTRRAMLGGLAVTPFALAPVAALAAHRSQKDIADRVHELAYELSELLGDLDNGQWSVRVSPPLQGIPVYQINPPFSPEVRIEQALSMAEAALAEIIPDRAFQRGVYLEAGFVFVGPNGWRS